MLTDITNMIDKATINPSSSSRSSIHSSTKSSRRKSISHVEIENFLSELPSVYEDKSSSVLTRSRRLSLNQAQKESTPKNDDKQQSLVPFIPPQNSDASMIREYCKNLYSKNVSVTNKTKMASLGAQLFGATGYPLAPYEILFPKGVLPTNFLTNPTLHRPPPPPADSTKELEVRRSIMLRVHSTYVANQHERQNETLNCERFTRCRGRKEKNSVYVYTDLETELTVSYEVYEERYAMFLQYAKISASKGAFGSESNSEEVCYKNFQALYGITKKHKEDEKEKIQEKEKPKEERESRLVEPRKRKFNQTRRNTISPETMRALAKDASLLDKMDESEPTLPASSSSSSSSTTIPTSAPASAHVSSLSSDISQSDCSSGGAEKLKKVLGRNNVLSPESVKLMKNLNPTELSQLSETSYNSTSAIESLTYAKSSYAASAASAAASVSLSASASEISVHSVNSSSSSSEAIDEIPSSMFLEWEDEIIETKKDPIDEKIYSRRLSFGMNIPKVTDEKLLNDARQRIARRRSSTILCPPANFDESFPASTHVSATSAPVVARPVLPPSTEIVSPKIQIKLEPEPEPEPEPVATSLSSPPLSVSLSTKEENQQSLPESACEERNISKNLEFEFDILSELEDELLPRDEIMQTSRGRRHSSLFLNAVEVTPLESLQESSSALLSNVEAEAEAEHEKMEGDCYNDLDESFSSSIMNAFQSPTKKAHSSSSASSNSAPSSTLVHSPSPSSPSSPFSSPHSIPMSSLPCASPTKNTGYSEEIFHNHSSLDTTMLGQNSISLLDEEDEESLNHIQLMSELDKLSSQVRASSPLASSVLAPSTIAPVQASPLKSTPAKASQVSQSSSEITVSPFNINTIISPSREISLPSSHYTHSLSDLSSLEQILHTNMDSRDLVKIEEAFSSDTMNEVDTFNYIERLVANSQPSEVYPVPEPIQPSSSLSSTDYLDEKLSIETEDPLSPHLPPLLSSTSPVCQYDTAKISKHGDMMRQGVFNLHIEDLQEEPNTSVPISTVSDSSSDAASVPHPDTQSFPTSLAREEPEQDHDWLPEGELDIEELERQAARRLQERLAEAHQKYLWELNSIRIQQKVREKYPK